MKDSSPSRRVGGPAQIAIIGSINRDEVWSTDGKRRHGWGGILYNIAALTRHAPAGTTILPIARLGRDARGPVGRWLRSFPHVNTAGLLPLDRAGNLCQMRYVNTNERREKLLHRVPPLKYRELRPAINADFLLVNFISGNDITIGALEQLRREFRGLIYMDIHSYLLGRRRDTTRFARRPSGWQRVVACANVLQMNEVEFATLSGQTAGRRSVADWVREAIGPPSCRCVIVTLGASGALSVTRAGRRWRLDHFASGRRPSGADPTGCGDTFSGLWLSAWLRGCNLHECTRLATHGAAHPIRPGV